MVERRKFPKWTPSLLLLVGTAHADCPETGPRLVELLHARRFADAHHAATAMRVLCGGSDDVRLVDDIALLRLEDREYALHDLESLNNERASAIIAWALVTDHDPAAAVLARLPPAKAAAIEAFGALDDDDAFAAKIRGLPVEAQARALAGQYHDARRKSPAFAGVLTALLPGAGQIYDGSFSAAAITFVLNGLFIGATAELADKKDYITASAAGVAASFFYVGGIMNAVDLARRQNKLAQQPYADQLEELLVPDVVLK